MGITFLSCVGLVALLTLRETIISKDYLNPLNCFFGYDVLLVSLVGNLSEGAEKYDKYYFDLISLYITGFVVGYFILRTGVIQKKIVLADQSKFPRLGLYLLLFGVINFAFLAVIGGGGLEWIFNTREAYINNRSGAGVFWLFMQWSILLSYIVIIFTTNIRGMRLIALTLFYSLVMFFSGSKSNVLSIAVVLAVYYNGTIARLTFSKGIILFIMLFFGFAFLLKFGGYESDNVIQGAANYFSEYGQTTNLYLSNEFLDRGYSKYLISSMWEYIPRAIFPSKPYEYGILMIHESLFPNAAETGNTRGINSWILSYLDFGPLGVFVYGLILGSVSKFVYKQAYGKQTSLFWLCAYINFCVYHVFALSNLILYINIYFVSRFFFNKSRQTLNYD